MAFETYSQISAGASEVVNHLTSNKTQLSDARKRISDVVTQLTAISAQYGPIVDAINAVVSADSSNPAKLALQAHISQLLTDFTTLQTEATALDVLVNPPPP